MRQSALLGIALVALLTGCSGPIATRIETALPAAPASGSSYILSLAEGKVGAIEADAVRLLESRLSGHGFTRTIDPEAAQYAVALSVAERPADMTYTTGGAPLAVAKSRKLMQSCNDRDLRVAVVITRVADAALAYRGSAAEYHCKAKMADVMPGLMDAALQGMSGKTGSWIEKRHGVD